MNARLTKATVGAIALSLLMLAAPPLYSEPKSDTPAKKQPPRDWNEEALTRLNSPPLGLPSVPEPVNNPSTVEKIALGRKLFFDRRLSANQTMSCAMCHIPEQGFTNNELSTPIGVEGRSLKRNAPTILNIAYAKQVFLDGRETSLESQAIVPLLGRDEMANPSAEWLVAKVSHLADYQGRFEEAFGGGPTIQRIGHAIASWERTLLAANSPFDRWQYGGEATALTANQKRGFQLFVGRAGCGQCHLVGDEHALFTDQEFHDTGIGYLRDQIERRETGPFRVEIAPQTFISVERKIVQQVGHLRPLDQGRFEITGDPADRWRFRTPSLRNVAVTAPYMHDGSLQTLDAVIRFYNRGGVPHRSLDPLIKPLGLSESEIASLVAFLQSLNADNLAVLAADARSIPVGN